MNKKYNKILKIVFATVLLLGSAALLSGAVDLGSLNSKVTDNSDVSAAEARLVLEPQMLGEGVYEVNVKAVNNDLSVAGAELYFLIDDDLIQNIEWVPSERFSLFFPIETNASFIYGITQAAETSIRDSEYELGKLMVTKINPNEKVSIKLLTEESTSSKVTTDIESEFNFPEVSVEF
ncbi:MAG: hypothetical protein KatS3mg086_137 [Candidatus Dojkabacteria bacterium]|nr:MAG: hypothetical protein KatS3mg086_137 [Candidatus Dojkabacteria bacterium]